MTTLMQAHRQWSSRAEDERFTSLIELQAFKRRVCEQSHSTVISSRKLAIEPTPDVVRGLMVVGDDAYDAAALTHWSFRQLCSLASPSNSPASYFRDTNMPAPVIADCLNYNLRFTRGVEDVTLNPSVGSLAGVPRDALTGPPPPAAVRPRSNTPGIRPTLSLDVP